MAKTNLPPDLECSLALINYLASSYQGRYAFFKALQNLGVAGVDERELPRSEDALKRVSRWFSDITQGSPLFSASWTSPGTFEAKRALDMLEAIKPELRWLSDVCTRVTQQNLFLDLPIDELRILAACNLRMKVMGHTYCLGNILFGEAMKLKDFAAYHQSLIPGLRAEMDAAVVDLEAFASADNQRGEKFMTGFAGECEKLSSIALTHIHDINLLTAPFRGGLSFLTVDLSDHEASKWITAGFNPTDAGYWRAYRFEPDEALLWRKVRIEMPAVALAWKGFGLEAPEAAHWIRLGFEAWDAGQWFSAGFSAQEARSFKDRGFVDPANVPNAK